MISKESIMAAVKVHLNRTLQLAEVAMPGDQFRAYRKALLDEFGKSGLEGELDRLLGNSEQERQGQGRNI